MSREEVFEQITNEEDLDILITCVELARVYSLQKSFYKRVLERLNRGEEPKDAMKLALEDLDL